MISLLSRPFCSSCSAQAIPTRHSLTEFEVITPQPRSSIFYGSHTSASSGFSTNSAIHTQLSKLPVSPDSTSIRTLMEHIEQNYNPNHIKVIIDNIQWYALACHYCDGKGQLPDNLSNIQVKN
ncbi:MAG: hypothetical protein O3A77_02460, partial [bacterium]|nr:hypothetical protein [bacterium]